MQNKFIIRCWRYNKKTSRSGQTLLEVFCILELASYGLVALIFSLIIYLTTCKNNVRLNLIQNLP